MHAISGLLDERSFSILEGYAHEKDWSRSKALRHLIKRGMGYGPVLKELEELQEAVAACERRGFSLEALSSGKYDDLIKTFNQVQEEEEEEGRKGIK